MFSVHLRRRCIDLYGVDPNVSYERMLADVRDGGPVSERLLDALTVEERGRWKLHEFTAAEREVVTLLCLGYCRYEIAALRVVSEDTVMKQIAKAKLRAGARTSAQLAAVSVARGLL